GDEPFRDEIDRRAFGAGGRIDREELRSQRDDVGHAAKLANPVSGSQFSGEHAASEIEERGIELDPTGNRFVLERVEQTTFDPTTFRAARNRFLRTRDR